MSTTELHAWAERMQALIRQVCGPASDPQGLPVRELREGQEVLARMVVNDPVPDEDGEICVESLSRKFGTYVKPADILPAPAPAESDAAGVCANGCQYQIALKIAMTQAERAEAAEKELANLERHHKEQCATLDKVFHERDEARVELADVRRLGAEEVDRKVARIEELKQYISDKLERENAIRHVLDGTVSEDVLTTATRVMVDLTAAQSRIDALSQQLATAQAQHRERERGLQAEAQALREKVEAERELRLIAESYMQEEKHNRALAEARVSELEAAIKDAYYDFEYAMFRFHIGDALRTFLRASRKKLEMYIPSAPPTPPQQEVLTDAEHTAILEVFDPEQAEVEASATPHRAPETQGDAIKVGDRVVYDSDEPFMDQLERGMRGVVRGDISNDYGFSCFKVQWYDFDTGHGLYGDHWDVPAERLKKIYPSPQPAAAPQEAGEEVPKWHLGEPPQHIRSEWFIAETTFGDRVVLTALPEEYSYDYRTADDTYIKADKIKRWMQFPDSSFIPYTDAATPTPRVAEAKEAVVLDVGTPVEVVSGCYFDNKGVIHEPCTADHNDGFKHWIVRLGTDNVCKREDQLRALGRAAE